MAESERGVGEFMHQHGTADVVRAPLGGRELERERPEYDRAVIADDALMLGREDEAEVDGRRASRRHCRAGQGAP